MEYSSTKSNRSQRSIKLEDIEDTNPQENSIIIEEKEIEDSTKYSDPKKNNFVLPSILNKSPQIRKTKKKLTFQNQPTYTYSLKFERSKLGTMSTRVIKAQVSQIRKRCESIKGDISEKGDLEITSTTDTPKNGGKFIQKMMKSPKVNKNHRYRNNQRLLKTLNRPAKGQQKKNKLRRSLNSRGFKK